MVPFVATRCCRPFWILPRGHRRAGVTNGEWRRLTSAGEGDSGSWSKESERRTTLTEHSTRTGIDGQHRCPADLLLVHVLVKGKANTATTYVLRILFPMERNVSRPLTIAPSCGKKRLAATLSQYLHARNWSAWHPLDRRDEEAQYSSASLPCCGLHIGVTT
jgi:hypothetical protein